VRQPMIAQATSSSAAPLQDACAAGCWRRSLVGEGPMLTRIACAAAASAMLLIAGCRSSTGGGGCPSGAPNPCGSGGTGYCANFASDNANCGGCGHQCAASERCTQGTCVGCPAGFTSCNALG